MKIGFVATEVGHQEGGAFMGGNVNNVISLSESLADRGHEIHIITTVPRDSAEDPAAPIDWATVHNLDTDFEHGSPGYGLSFIYHAVRTTTQLDREGKLDVLSVHAGFTLWAIINRFVNAFTGCSSLHVQYCPIDEPSGNSMYDILQSPRISRQYLKGIDQLVAVSPNTAESIRSIAPNENVKVIPPGIDVNEYTPTAASRFDLFETEKPVIGYMGSLKEQKGLDLLVEAFKHVKEDFPVELALALEVRSDRSNSKLKEEIDEDDDIHCYGLLNDVPAFLARSDIFAVPFRTTMGPADYPISALEAMACETPLVATDVGGLSELTDSNDTGICVKEPRVSSLYDGLKTLISEEENREKKGKNAREYIVNNCSIESMVAEYERLFEQL